MAWKKGQSGNPTGRPKIPDDVKETFRALTTDAANALASIVRDDDAPPAARVAAATTILDRGWGKPQQDITVKHDPLDGIDTTGLLALAGAITAAAGSAGAGDTSETQH